jgi:hypothetical protein
MRRRQHPPEGRHRPLLLIRQIHLIKWRTINDQYITVYIIPISIVDRHRFNEDPDPTVSFDADLYYVHVSLTRKNFKNTVKLLRILGIRLNGARKSALKRSLRLTDRQD